MPTHRYMQEDELAAARARAPMQAVRAKYVRPLYQPTVAVQAKTSKLARNIEYALIAITLAAGAWFAWELFVFYSQS